MSSGVAPNSSTILTPVAAGDRVSAGFHDTLWGDHFIQLVADHDSLQGSHSLESEREILKEEVRKMVTAEYYGDDDPAVAKKLELIDAIQRLGVGYHFESEIEQALEKIHGFGDRLFISNDDDNNVDLYHAALGFRLLRQQGFHVSQDVFRKFQDSQGRFKESLALHEEQGLLSLYEAAHVAVNGEKILDIALTFATATLKSILQEEKSHYSFQKQVKFALGIPAWKCVPRTLTRHYIDFYSEEPKGCNQTLLRFAKLDFNMLQKKLHQQELRQVSQWWENLEPTTNFPHVRDRVVESYYWAYATYFEPKYHLARVIVSKTISMLALLDDTFDNFAEYEEAKIFTQTIQRWDKRDLDVLPNEMKNLHRVIIDLYDEIEMELANIGPTFAVEYAKDEVKKICRFYLKEVEWRTNDYFPTMEEQKMVTYGSSCFTIICASAFVGMGAEIATKEAFEWVINEPKMVRAGNAIYRLHNDIVSHQFERNRKHVPSMIECYMKEYVASEEEAVAFCKEEISKAWKDIVEECQKPAILPVTLTDRVLNLARSVSVIYEKGDGYTNSYLMKAHLDSLFVDPTYL